MSPSKKLILKPIDDLQRKRILNVFGDMLSRQTKESEWQAFFDEYPNIFSDGLQIRWTGLYSQVPLVSGIPDYVYHTDSINPFFGDFGVIELKRPDQLIIGVYSAKHIQKSRKLDIAVEEVKRHLEAIRKRGFVGGNEYFIAGNRAHAFIIIGRSEEITDKCASELFRMQFQDLLPSGFHLYTYDEIFSLFAMTVKPHVHIVQTGPTQYRLAECDLGELLKQNVKRVEPLLTAKGLRLDFKSQGNLKANLSQGDVERLIFNLLSNAEKYSYRGEGRHIELKAWSDSALQEVAFSVSNVGVPIRKDEIDGEQIFRFGTRGEFARMVDRSGFGVGLADASETIKAHGGSITVESRPVVDDIVSTSPSPETRFLTTFTVKLPRGHSARLD